MRQRIFIKRTILGSYSKKTRRIARISPETYIFHATKKILRYLLRFRETFYRARNDRPFARKRTSHRSLDVFKRELSKNVHEFLLRVSCWSQGRNLSSRISLVPLTNFGSVPMCQSALASARYA